MQKRLFSVILLCVTVAIPVGTAFAGLFVVELPDEDIEVTYVGDISGQASASTGLNRLQFDKDEVPFGFAAANSSVDGGSAAAMANNAFVFKAFAEMRSSDTSKVVLGGAGATALGGEVIVVDFRKSDVIPESLTAYFGVDGQLIYSLDQEDLENGGLGFATMLWEVASLVGNNTLFQTDTIFTLQHGPFAVHWVNTRDSISLPISYRWLLPDKSTTLVDQGRRPDFGVLGYEEELNVGASLQGVQGWARADYFSSATLEAILFDDGSTPESHGIDLYFASGRNSPNSVSAVPEPTSIALLASGAFCVFGLRVRKNRLKS